MRKIRLNSPAGNLPSLTAAVDAGAESVYIGFRSPTNLRNLPGLNFSVDEAAEGVQYAHERGAKVHVAVNTYPRDQQLPACFQAVDQAVEIGADAVIATDWAVLDYARTRHSQVDVHLSCMAGAADSEAISFYCEEFDVDRIILPRALSLRQIAVLRAETDVLLEVMVFGVLCSNYEGRCSLSTFITGTSTNSLGACAPVEFVEFEQIEDGRLRFMLNGISIGEFAGGEQRTYPTPCKGKYHSPILCEQVHAFQEPCCLNALPLLADLAAAGVDAVKIEGRQRSFAYVRLVTEVWREAIDALGESAVSDPQTDAAQRLQSVIEGHGCTLGALSGG